MAVQLKKLPLKYRRGGHFPETYIGPSNDFNMFGHKVPGNEAAEDAVGSETLVRRKRRSPDERLRQRARAKRAHNEPHRQLRRVAKTRRQPKLMAKIDSVAAAAVLQHDVLIKVLASHEAASSRPPSWSTSHPSAANQAAGQSCWLEPASAPPCTSPQVIHRLPVETAEAGALLSLMVRSHHHQGRRFPLLHARW
jgi:hypothetical protein